MAERSIGELANSIMKRLEKNMDRYEWWRAALAGEVWPIHTEPQAGFFRRKLKDGTMAGIAIWFDGDKPLALSNRKPADPNEAWISGAKRPVNEEAYREWERTGVWPDDHKIEAPPAGVGHNEPPDEIDVLRDQIESAKADAADYATVTSDEQASKAQSFRSRLLELSREADKKRETEKRPHFEAAKAVDAKWQPLVKAAKEIADQIARAMSAWETKKAKAAADAQRKADEERRRREEEARAAEEAGRPKPEPEPTAEPPAAPPPTRQVRGAYGRAASVRVVKVALVTDQDAAYGYFKDDVEMIALIAKLAQRSVDQGLTVPGVEVDEQRKVA